MTQRELAKQIGISQQEISRYEKGEIKAPINYIIDVAECCGVSVDYILDREPEPVKNDTEKIVEMYNRLSDENKIRAAERIQALLDMQEKR